MPHFGVCYSPATNRVTRIIHVDYNENDSEDNIKAGLREHCPPGSAMIFIPVHQFAEVESIMAGMGVKYMQADD